MRQLSGLYMLTVLAVVRWSSLGVTVVMVVHLPLLYEIQYRGSFAASWQSLLRLHLQNINKYKLLGGMYSGSKITASLENVTVRAKKDGKGKRKARWRRV
jgi:hypothetical protein